MSFTPCASPVHSKRPELWHRNNWLLLDNKPLHIDLCFPRGADNTTGHHLATPSILTWSQKTKQTNSVALSLQANYTDWTTATCRQNLMPTFVDRGVSRGQRGGSPTVLNLSFLDRTWSHFMQFHFISLLEKSHVGVDFSWPRRLSLLQGDSYGTYLLKSFSSISSSYTNVGRLAFWPMATILRKDEDVCKSK
jgi:hypothetical protein